MVNEDFSSLLGHFPLVDISSNEGEDHVVTDWLKLPSKTLLLSMSTESGLHSTKHGSLSSEISLGAFLFKSVAALVQVSPELVSESRGSEPRGSELAEPPHVAVMLEGLCELTWTRSQAILTIFNLGSFQSFVFVRNPMITNRYNLFYPFCMLSKFFILFFYHILETM